MSIRYLTAGESHGPKLMAILEGFPAGLELDQELINQQLERRQRGFGSGPRMKSIENDKIEILSGVMAGQTTGGPIGLIIENLNHSQWSGEAVPPYTVPRPGHADLTAALKYGYPDLRHSLERASARETAVRVAVGAICRQFLVQFGIQIGGYVCTIGHIKADLPDIPLSERARIAEANEVRAPDPAVAAEMVELIKEIIRERDTIGGTIQVFVTGLPVGLGSHVHWDRRLDSRLGAAVLSVQAMKGVEIGAAFENATMKGTNAHDAIRKDGDRIVRPTNRAGGLEGGITNGEPLLILAAMKPIATTLTPQASVNLVTGEEVSTNYERSDYCPVPRAVPILEAVIAFEIAQALIEKLGGDSIDEMKYRFENLPEARLSDIDLTNQSQVFWPGDEN
jgi:chorismate synthase